MKPKKTLVIGASSNPSRYSFKAIKMLQEYGHAVEAIGLRKDLIGEIEIQIGFPSLQNIDTVTMYIGSDKQKPYFEYIVALQPKRVIFNPGTENDEFQKLLHKNGIEVIENCTLVMLSYGRY